MTTHPPTTWHGGEPIPAARSSAAPRHTPGQAGAAEDGRGVPGAVIGDRYALRAALGHGGMGTVWRATDTLLRRDVAVKEVILPRRMETVDRDHLYLRTLREARAAAALSHPSVVQVYDVVTEGGRPWIVMELLQSRSLAEVIVEDGPLGLRAVAKIGIAMLGALEVAHAAGVLHRDVKPANVLICADGRCVLSDFGVAHMLSDVQLTTPGMVLGSPHFISPERAIGGAFGPPSDLFSLGVTLYTAVEGRPPFDRPDPFETMRAVVEEPPAPMSRAGVLAGVLTGLLEKDPRRRWDVQTSRGVLRDLLSGALASNAPAHVTDPYAVVPPAPYAPLPAPPVPTGQIGGRAMLAPGESLTGALRRRQATAAPATAPATATATATATAPAAPPAPAPAPAQRSRSGAVPAQRGQDDAGHTDGYLSANRAQPSYPTQPGRSAPSELPARPPAGNRPRHAHRAVPQQRGAKLLAGTGAGVRGASGRLLGRIQRLPKPAKWGLVAGVAVLLVLLTVTAVTVLGSSSPGSVPAARPTPSADKPLIDVQQHHDSARGLTVNVPALWRQSTPNGGTYVDYIDPNDAGRWVRINVEPASGTGRTVLESAARRFATPAGGCPNFQQLALTEGKLSGQPAATLEYTCAPATGARHGIWQVTVINGQAYQVTLSTPAARFDESRVIFEEMARSFRIGS